MISRDIVAQWNIYAITNRAMAGGRTHSEIGAELMDGGVRVIQVRDKETPYPDLLKDVQRLVAMARERGVSIIANDNPYLTRDADADGVHLGQTDCSVPIARDIIGSERILGLSTHSRHQALAAQKMDLDYIGLGPIFSTDTKTTAHPPLGLKIIRWAAATLDVPFTVIGGITSKRLPDVLAAGARHCAMISGLMSRDNIAEATRECIQLYDQIMHEDTFD